MFIAFRFPGLKPKDNILSLLLLMASKNPNNDIAARVVLDGGYNPCQTFAENSSFWTDTTGGNPIK